MARQPAFDEIADELYAEPPSGFTTARNDRIRSARTARDAELAAGLRSLRRPTAAAWLANLLVRERPREVAQLVELGGKLRDAQTALDGDAIRRLSERRRDIIDALSREARHLADGRGEKVGDGAVRELEGTLEAAMFDPGAAEELGKGRLTGSLTYYGIGFPPGAGASGSGADSARGAPRDGRRASTSGSDSVANRSAPPESALLRLRHEARDARRAAERCERTLADARRVSERQDGALAAAEAELATRRDAARAARRDVTRARAERDAAERAAAKAEQRLASAIEDVPGARGPRRRRP